MRSVCSSGKGGRDCCRSELRNVLSGDLRRDLLSVHEQPVSSAPSHQPHLIAQGIHLLNPSHVGTVCRNTMQAFSVRQLKSNPSTVLRAAEADAMALLTSHQEPTALVVALDRLGLPDTGAVRSGLALSLFQAGSLSVGAAAKIAGLPLTRFLEILASLRIPVTDATAVELDDDLAQARRWLAQEA